MEAERKSVLTVFAAVVPTPRNKSCALFQFIAAGKVVVAETVEVPSSFHTLHTTAEPLLYHSIQRICPSAVVSATAYVTVVAPDAGWADALATGLFVMGPVKGMALIERLGFGAVIVDAQGGILVSSRLRGRVKLTP